MFFAPIRRNGERTRWLSEDAGLEGRRSRVLSAQGRGWGFCSPESFTRFRAGSRHQGFEHRCVLRPAGMPAERTAGGLDARERFLLPPQLNTCSRERRQRHRAHGDCGAGGVRGGDADSLPPSLGLEGGGGGGRSALAL